MKVSFKALELGLSLLPIIGISLAPETFTEGGGGLLDDVDVQFLALKFVTWDYNKPGQKAAPFLKIDMLPEGTQDVHTEYLRAGDLEHWAPTIDGETLAPQSDKAKEARAITKSCNAAMFITSLVQAGLPSSKLETERISELAGVKCHVVRNKRPKDNIQREAGAKEPTILTVSRIISTPWSGATAPATSPAQATAAAVAAGAGTVATPPVKREAIGNGTFGDAELGMLAMQILTEHGGSLKKAVLVQEVYKAALAGAVSVDAKDENGKPARSTVSGKLFNDAFLQSQPYWRYDGTTVTLQ